MTEFDFSRWQRRAWVGVYLLALPFIILDRIRKPR